MNYVRLFSCNAISEMNLMSWHIIISWHKDLWYKISWQPYTKWIHKLHFLKFFSFPGKVKQWVIQSSSFHSDDHFRGGQSARSSLLPRPHPAQARRRVIPAWTGRGLGRRLVHVQCSSLVPRPHPLTRKRVWWSLSNFLVRFWTSQWNSATSYECWR